jgi:hypothetical protein
MKKIEFFEDNGGGLYVAILQDCKVIYTASDLQFVKDDRPENYITMGDDEDSWERGGWSQDDDPPDDSAAYAHTQDAHTLIAEYDIDYPGIITSTIRLDRAGFAGRRFLGLENA